MVSMYRNTNLEEINTDAFLGIEFLNYQSLLQKIIFFSGFVIALGISVVCVFVFDIDVALSFLLAVPFILPSVLFGCNYNQDLSLAKYLYLNFKEPVVKFTSRTTESVDYINEKAHQYSNIDINNVSTEDSSNTTLKLIIFGVCIGVLLISVIIFRLIFNTDVSGVHHTI